MKTKLHLVFLILAATFISCDKPVLTDDAKAVPLIGRTTRGAITVEDDYIIKPSLNQLIVKFDANKTEEERRKVRDSFFLEAPVEQCKCGDTNIELWTIDTDQLAIEDAVKSIKRSGRGGVEGDLGFEIKLSTFKDYKAKQKWADPTPFVSPPTGSSVNIAIVDTGLDFLTVQTPLYSTAGLQECYKTLSGWNFVENSNNIIDDQGHGSAVTSIITSELVANNIDYRILPLKVFDNKGLGSYWDVVCAFGYIKEIQKNGGRIDIINTSFGGLMSEVADQEVLKGIMEDISSKSLIVASAGNNSMDTDIKGNGHFLSSYTSENLLAVGGYTWDKSVGLNSIEIHEDSNYGEVSIDVAAPYSDSYVLRANRTYLLEGTSYATAYIAGIAVQKAISNGRPEPYALRQIVQQSAIQAAGLKSKIGGARAILKE